MNVVRLILMALVVLGPFVAGWGRISAKLYGPEQLSLFKHAVGGI